MTQHPCSSHAPLALLAPRCAKQARGGVHGNSPASAGRLERLGEAPLVLLRDFSHPRKHAATRPWVLVPKAAFFDQASGLPVFPAHCHSIAGALQRRDYGAPTTEGFVPSSIQEGKAGETRKQCRFSGLASETNTGWQCAESNGNPCKARGRGMMLL